MSNHNLVHTTDRPKIDDGPYYAAADRVLWNTYDN